ncbi:MAG TPA: hypothetical protein PLO53_13210 [Candidatus Hydrogenedentes bacterium]|nr:hypothetical protein [Candidatus Hydrogenedentota bacterium]HPU98894.1 hypothetical protein [Candidatus Hydrogenedentota bacterium]
MKKHLHVISAPQQAQVGAATVVTIVGTVMSALGGILLALAPVVGKL